jgi:hypothetical protein
MDVRHKPGERVKVRTVIGTRHLTFKEMLQVSCPACQARPQSQCWYLIPGKSGKWQSTEIKAQRPHKARRKARLQLRETLRRVDQVSIRNAMQEFDLKEHLQLKKWLQENADLFEALNEH